MKKKAAKKKASGARAAKPAIKRTLTKPKRAAAKPTKSVAKKAVSSIDSNDQLNFNQAMIYVKDVQCGLEFYRDWLGFQLIEDFLYEGKPVYARLRAPGGDGTIALHQAAPGTAVASEGVRLYFDVGDLDDVCRKLRYA